MLGILLYVTHELPMHFYQLKTGIKNVMYQCLLAREDCSSHNTREALSYSGQSSPLDQSLKISSCHYQHTMCMHHTPAKNAIWKITTFLYNKSYVPMNFITRKHEGSNQMEVPSSPSVPSSLTIIMWNFNAIYLQ